jgi:hypothetical protein
MIEMRSRITPSPCCSSLYRERRETWNDHVAREFSDHHNTADPLCLGSLTIEVEFPRNGFPCVPPCGYHRSARAARPVPSGAVPSEQDHDIAA